MSDVPSALNVVAAAMAAAIAPDGEAALMHAQDLRAAARLKARLTRAGRTGDAGCKVVEIVKPLPGSPAAREGERMRRQADATAADAAAIEANVKRLDVAQEVFAEAARRRRLSAPEADGALRVSLPPALGAALADAATRHGAAPHDLALDILGSVLGIDGGADILAAVLNRPEP